MSEIVTYKSMAKFYCFMILGTLLCFFIYYYLVSEFMPITQLEWFSFLGVFLLIPVLTSCLSFLYGWNYKKNIIQYTPPEWDFNSIQMTIEDAKKLPHTYNKKFAYLVSNSNFWMFFIPVVLIIIIPSLSLNVLFENPTTDHLIAPLVFVLVFLETNVPLMSALTFALLFLVTLVGAFKSTSNGASADFTLPLIREAVKLAQIQEKVPGINHVRVVLDKAESGSFYIYDQPRVVIRITGLESEAYIESWSDDLRAITRVLCRLYETDKVPQVIWWWVSTDRNFRKFIHPDENGYYVKNPIPSKIVHLGVKDITLVTENAVALIIKEYLQTSEESDELRAILGKLNVDNV